MNHAAPPYRMKVARLVRAAFVVSALTVLCSALAPAGSAQVPGCGAASLSIGAAEGLAARAREAANARDTAALAALAVDPTSVVWCKRVTGRARSTGWTVSAVAQPGAGRPTLIVFSAPNGLESTGDHVHPVVQTAAGPLLGPEIPESDTGGYQAVDHDIAIRFDLPAHACTVVDQVTVNRTAGARPYLLLRLSADMTCESVQIGGAAATAAWAPGIIMIAPPPGSGPFAARIAYRGVVHHDSWDYIGDRETLLSSYWYPHTGRLPARSTVRATVPLGWRAVAPGEIAEIVPRRHMQVFRYRNEIPVSFVTLTAAPYAPVSRKVAGRTLTVFQLHRSTEVARRALDELAGALAFYERTFGRFPYSHYDIVETLGTDGAALEGYSFAVFSASTLPNTIAHELSHTWWGGIVPCTYLHSMWNESLATYSETLYRRVREGAAGPATSGLRSNGEDPARAFPVPVADAFDTEDDPHNAAGYAKGGTVLAMLEDTLGRETMIRCLRRFVSDHKPGNAAEWSDFEQAVNRVTGGDYGWFFRQWLERAGAPVVGLGAARAERTSSGWSTVVAVEQTGAPYRLKVPIVVTTVGGAARSVVTLDGPRTNVRVATSGRPVRIEVDPAGTILMSGTPANPTLSRDL